MDTTEVLNPISREQNYINLFLERSVSGKPYLFSDVFGSDPLSSEEYKSAYTEMIRFMRENDEGSQEAVAIKNVFFANLVQFFQIYGHKKFINDTHEFIEDLSYETVVHILKAIKKGGTFELEKGNFLSYAIKAFHSTRIRLARTYARAKKAFPMSQLDYEDWDYASTIPEREPKEDLETEILISKVQSAIESVLKGLSEKEIKKGWGDILERFFLKEQSQGKIYEELGVSRACFVACHRSMRKRLRMAIVQKCDKTERRGLAKGYFSKVIEKLPDTTRELVSLHLASSTGKNSKEEIAKLLNPSPSSSDKELRDGLRYVREEFIKCGLAAELQEILTISKREA